MVHNCRVFKRPLGIFKVLELVFSLVALLTVVCYSVSTGYVDNRHSCRAVHIDFGFPFELVDLPPPLSPPSCSFDSATQGIIPAESCLHKNVSTFSNRVLIEGSYSITSHIWVITAIVSILYTIVVALLYIFAWPSYYERKPWAIVDLVITAVLALVWLGVSIAWCLAVDGIKQLTNAEAMMKAINSIDKSCRDLGDCRWWSRWGYTPLIIGAIAGFICFLLFLVNLWFVYKETVYNNRKKVVEISHGESETPLEL